MPLLVVNGLTVPIFTDSLSRTRDELGEAPRSFDGTMRTHRRYTKTVLEFQLPIKTQEELLAWTALLRGEGQVWPFDSTLYSAKGVPVANALAAVGTTAPTPKYGAGRLGGGGATTTFPALVGTPWTVMLWLWSGSVWNHYVVDSSARKWLNGVRADATSTTFLSVTSAGSFTLTTNFYDDVVALPCTLPTTFPPVLYATGRAFPLAPRLEVYGDLLPGTSAASPMVMRGEVGDITYKSSFQGGSFTATTGTVEVTLRQE